MDKNICRENYKLDEDGNKEYGIHRYQVFSNSSETCYGCGFQHPEITAWKSAQVRAMETGERFTEEHPYVVSGTWTRCDLKRFMASPRTKRYITK